MAVRREVFFKRLHPLIEHNPLIAGAAVIGTGGVMFALDTPALFARAAHWLEPEPEPNAPASPIAHEREEPCSAD
jgi:two-component system chemotaxis sensor kinase CheA